jgi:hypothetical protein
MTLALAYREIALDDVRRCPERVVLHFMEQFLQLGRTALLIDVTDSPRVAFSSPYPVAWESRGLQEHASQSRSFIWYCDRSPADIVCAWHNLTDRFREELGAASLPPSGGLRIR